MVPWLQKRSTRRPSLPGKRKEPSGLQQRMLRRAREAVAGDRETLSALLHDDRCLELILHESKLAKKLLLDSRSLERVVADADFLVTLADSESLLDYLRRHAHLLGKLLDDDELVEKVVEDERVVEALLRNELVLARLFDDERTSQLFGGDRARLSRIADGNDFAQLILDDPEAMQRMIDHTPVKQALAEHPSVLEATLASARGSHQLREALLSDPENLERVVSDERTLIQLIEQNHTLDRVLLSDRARARMRSSRRLLDQLIEDPGFIAELFLDPRVVKKLMSNRMLLRGLLQEQDIQQVFLECMPAPPVSEPAASPQTAPPLDEGSDESLRELLESPALALLFREDEALLTSLLSNEGLRERIAGHPLLGEQAPDPSGATATTPHSPALVASGGTEDEGARARFELARYWNEFAPHLDARHKELEDRLAEALPCVTALDQIPDTLAQVIATGGEVFLREGQLQLPGGVRALDDLYQVLVAGRYAFDCTTNTPRILDCGAQAGLSTIGFKRAYPQARITTVEPAPALRQATRANLKAMGIDDVEHLAHAISPERASLPFAVGTDGRGGTLVPVTATETSTGKRIKVRARPLSDLLRDPVDFLKLDVAGTEAAILEDAEEELANVKQIFVEMHDTGNDFAQNLARIFAVLGRAGFECQVVPRVGPATPTGTTRHNAPSSSRETLGIRALRG